MWIGTELLTEISRVDWVKDGAVDLEEGVAGIDGQLLDLRLVLGVGVVAVAIGPEPEL